MPEEDPPYWVLISVLFSSTPLSSSLAMTLHQAAYDLYQRDASAAEIDRELTRGTVRNLRKDALLGAMGGPCFEAELDTERGHAQVRFFLTRSGLELMNARQDAAPGRPRYVN
jgi:hypothetical protein